MPAEPKGRGPGGEVSGAEASSAEASSGDASTDEARAVYSRFRRLFGEGSVLSADAKKRATTKTGSTVPFGRGRDPEGLGGVIDGLTAKLGWNSPLAKSELLASWAEIAGNETAEHSRPISIEDGTLAVSCDSTAWATQLRLMRSEIASKIAQRFPDAGIDQVRFEGPNAPSWKRGPRTIPGRGPRDTYG
jgi:predicted nucleic acid-binding Zn ribbon protein